MNYEQLTQTYFSHFAQRLNERYGLFISYEEYITYCKKEYILLTKISRHKKIIFMSIKNKVVLAIRASKQDAILLTALPSDCVQLRNCRAYLAEMFKSELDKNYSQH